jgi:hypothetical protein
MANYISSHANRFYVAAEAAYGQAAAITPGNRFPAVKLQAQQVLEGTKRLDKTGTRTFLGAPKTARRHTAFEVRSYLTSWSGSGEPGYGPLFRAGMGNNPQFSGALSIAAVQNATQIQTSAPHGLSFGSGISFLNEIRFVTSVIDTTTVTINAGFSTTPVTGQALSPTVTYSLASALPSLTLYDYWDPITTVSRMLTGAAVDTVDITVNGDYHEFAFGGPAADLLDSSSFTPGTAGVNVFPSEPALGAFNYSIVPGHLGQVWLGNVDNQFFTLTAATIEVKNHIELRNQEFGSSYPRAIAPGMRQVSSRFTVFAQDDTQTNALYQAAKARNLVSAMLQLGQQQSELMGIFLPQVTPEIPVFNDSETRLQWEFNSNLAQGISDDELFIAFA